MVLSSLAFSGVKLHSLRISGMLGYGWSQEGVAIQALAVPDDFLRSVSELRDLEIGLETNDSSFKGQNAFDFPYLY